MSEIITRIKKFLFERDAEIKTIEDLCEPEAPVVVPTHDPDAVIGLTPSFVGRIKNRLGVEKVKKETGLTPRQRLKRYDAIHMRSDDNNARCVPAKK